MGRPDTHSLGSLPHPLEASENCERHLAAHPHSLPKTQNLRRGPLLDFQDTLLPSWHPFSMNRKRVELKIFQEPAASTVQRHSVLSHC